MHAALVRGSAATASHKTWKIFVQQRLHVSVLRCNERAVIYSSVTYDNSWDSDDPRNQDVEVLNLVNMVFTK